MLNFWKKNTKSTRTPRSGCFFSGHPESHRVHGANLIEAPNSKQGVLEASDDASMWCSTDTLRRIIVCLKRLSNQPPYFERLKDWTPPFAGSTFLYKNRLERMQPGGYSHSHGV